MRSWARVWPSASGKSKEVLCEEGRAGRELRLVLASRTPVNKGRRGPEQRGRPWVSGLADVHAP
jgi:hypothetical protein